MDYKHHMTSMDAPKSWYNPKRDQLHHIKIQKDELCGIQIHHK